MRNFDKSTWLCHGSFYFEEVGCNCDGKQQGLMLLNGKVLWLKTEILILLTTFETITNNGSWMGEVFFYDNSKNLNI